MKGTLEFFNATVSRTGMRALECMTNGLVTLLDPDLFSTNSAKAMFLMMSLDLG